MIRSLGARRGIARRPVLVAAYAAGLVAAFLAAGEPGRDGAWPAVAQASAADVVRVQAPVESAPKPPAADPAQPPASVDAEITIGDKGVVIKRHRGDRAASDIVIDGREFDSFEEFVEKAPWLAGLVFMVTALVFVVPLLVIVLVVWYKMRTNRLRNETMLKLAERGVVAPAAAIDALGSSPPGAALATAPATAPLYEQAKAMQKRAVWSDLRKGVILVGIGLGLSVWSAWDDGAPNALGLVLLFVGIGYLVLWYFEDRQAGVRDRGALHGDGKGGP